MFRRLVTSVTGLDFGAEVGNLEMPIGSLHIRRTTMKPHKPPTIVLTIVLPALLAGNLVATPLGTAFTYQGVLNDSDGPVAGSYDMRFAIYDAVTDGSAVGSALTNTVAVSNGLFTVTLDFGSGTFAGEARWLEIGVRTNGSAGDFTAMSPRQTLTSAPYALYAPGAGTAGSASNLLGVLAAGQLSGTYPNALNLSNPANSLSGDGSQLTGIGTSALADNSVTSAKMVDGAVSTADIADSAIITAKLADNAVTSAKIVDGTITSSDIGDGQVGTVELAANAVTTARLADNSVTSAKIADASVGTADVADSAITTAKLTDNSVTSAKIVDGTITSADLGDGQVATVDLAANAVTTAKLADSAVTSAKIVDGAVSTTDLADGSVTTAKLTDNSITSAKIADGTITSADIGDGQVATADLVANAVTSAKLADDANSLAKVTSETMFVWGGNVGIGTSVPAEELAVSGNAYVTGNLGINVDPASVALDVNGDIRGRGLIRSGIETRTSGTPYPAGLVVRRINSVNTSSNLVVAVGRNSGNTANVTLERDGSGGGFLIRYPANPGRLTIASMGLDNTGATKNYYKALNNPASAGTVQIYADSANVVHFECTFGDTYDSGQHVTQATLSRYDGDTWWAGTVVSTYNQ